MSKCWYCNNELTSLEELELANIPEGEIYAVADLLASVDKEDKK